MRSLTLGTLADEDVEGLLRAACDKAGSSSKPPAGPLEEAGGSNEAESQARALGGMARCGDRRAALLPGGDAQGPARRGHAPHTKPRGRGDGRGGRPGLAGQRSALRGLLPKSVREVIRARLSRLSPAGSELLRAGAVLERGFDFESVVGVAGLGEAEGLRGLDELIERHLLREEAGGREKRRSHSYTQAPPTPSRTRR